MTLTWRFIQAFVGMFVLASIMAARCSGTSQIDINGQWAGLATITESTDSSTPVGETTPLTVEFLSGPNNVVIAVITSEVPGGGKNVVSLAGTRNGNSVDLGQVQDTQGFTVSVAIVGTFSQTEFSGSFHTSYVDHTEPANNYERAGIIVLRRQ